VKLAKLLHPEKPTILWRDLIGKVYWGDYENVGVNYLYHREGPDFGQKLYADWEVLTGTGWKWFGDQD